MPADIHQPYGLPVHLERDGDTHYYVHTAANTVACPLAEQPPEVDDEADTARDLADAQKRLDQIRDYAEHLRTYGEAYRDTGADYLAHVYAEIALALERKIGGEQ